MPELADVEGFRRLVAQHAAGRQIDDVVVHDPIIVRTHPVSSLVDGLRHRTVGAARRHGKWLIVETNGPQLLLHFGMTGALRWLIGATQAREDRVTIRVGDGSLVVRDRRNLGSVALIGPGDDPAAVTGPLGPDAQRISRGELDDALGRSRRSLKVTLLDQATVAGLGNMLTDEVLWVARLDPVRRADGLQPSERVGLHGAIRRVVGRAARAGHIPRGPTWLSGQRRAQDPRCPRCGGALQWRRVAARSSLWCPRCQR